MEQAVKTSDITISRTARICDCFIIHTNESWVNYLYQREVAHDEYEVKRIFDSGVAELLFPQEIYFLNHQTVRNNMIALFRRQIEEAWLWSANGSG